LDNKLISSDNIASNGSYQQTMNCKRFWRTWSCQIWCSIPEFDERSCCKTREAGLSITDVPTGILKNT